MPAARIAVIDDDPVEHLLITEMASELGLDIAFDCYTSLDACLEAGVDAFTHIFLDRRLPPYNEYTETLPKLAEAGFTGKIILMTAHDPGLETGAYPFSLIGPVDKLELIEPDRFRGVLGQGTLAA